jgi:hypothetical protein
MLQAIVAVVGLAVFWTVLHALHSSSKSLPGNSILPIAASRRDHSPTKVTLKDIRLHIHTTAWNSTHDRLSASLRQRDNATTRAALTWFYSAGALAGLLGMLGAVGLLAWTSLRLSGTPLDRRTTASSGFTKRDGGDSFVKPIVSMSSHHRERCRRNVILSFLG